MKEKPLVDRVDVVIGEGEDARLITVAKKTADRWPETYRPALTAKGNLTADAKKAEDLREIAPEPITNPDDLPSAPNPDAASSAPVTTAGDAGVTTEGVTS